jgi:hypothetical protein
MPHCVLLLFWSPGQTHPRIELAHPLVGSGIVRLLANYFPAYARSLSRLRPWQVVLSDA